MRTLWTYKFLPPNPITSQKGLFLPNTPFSEMPPSELFPLLSELQHFCRQMMAVTADATDKNSIQKLKELTRTLKEIEAWLRNLHSRLIP
jgi:hypothetical protein